MIGGPIKVTVRQHAKPRDRMLAAQLERVLNYHHENAAKACAKALGLDCNPLGVMLHEKLRRKT